MLLASTGLFGLVLGMVRANALGWTSAYVLTALIGGASLVAAFIRWELRTDAADAADAAVPVARVLPPRTAPAC